MPSPQGSVHDFEAVDIQGRHRPLSEFAGHVLLIVNVASQCGFTRQYAGLQDLYRRFHERGFEILAFPCNQFGNQEPGDAAQIGEFCSTRFGVSFPLFAKIDVNGDGAHPLFRHLKAAAPGLLGLRGIKWNFTKFLVDRDGRVLQRYAPNTSPEHLAGDIERLLQTPAG